MFEKLKVIVVAPYINTRRHGTIDYNNLVINEHMVIKPYDYISLLEEDFILPTFHFTHMVAESEITYIFISLDRLTICN
jgi:hypothetical protein